MKTFHLSAVQLLKDFGFDIILFIAGTAGAITFLTKSPKLNRLQKFTTVLSGGCTANYLTPLVANWFNLSDKTLYGIAFLLGYGGLKLLEKIYSLFEKKLPIAAALNLQSNSYGTSDYGPDQNAAPESEAGGPGGGGAH